MAGGSSPRSSSVESSSVEWSEISWELDIQPTVIRQWKRRVETGGATAVAANEDDVVSASLLRAALGPRRDRPHLAAHLRLVGCDAEGILKELQELLGYSSSAMTMRHAHLPPEHLRTAVPSRRPHRR
jgi:hypothetical protein